MMARLLLLIIVGGVTVIPTAGSAQICSGFVSFAERPYQVFGGASFGDEAKSFSGGFALGGAGVFGQLAIGTTGFDNLDGSSFNLSVGAGHQVSLDKRNNAYLCPIASVGFSSGPNDIDIFGDGSLVVDLSERDFAFGIAFGAVASRSGQTQIIPTASLAFINASVKATDQSGASGSESETFGLLGLGLGFVFNQVFTLRPGIAIPFGLEGASTSFGLTLSANFGRRGQ